MQPRAHDAQAQARAQSSLYHCVGSEPCLLASAAWKKKNKTALLRPDSLGWEASVLPPSCTLTLRPIASPGPEKAASKDA